MFVSIFTIQRLVEDLKKERKAVEDKMALAEDELQKTENLARMLADSKIVRKPRHCEGYAMLQCSLSSSSHTLLSANISV